MLASFYQEIVLSWNEFIEHAILIFPRYFAGTIVFLVFWIVSRIERGMTRKVLKRVKDTTKKEATILIARLTRIIFVIIGFVAGLTIIGVNWTALATGVGLVGFGVSFALKDYIENFLAGVIILTQKPFSIGDQIEIGEAHGIVEVIATRYTVIKSFDSCQVIVPNSDMLSKAIIRDNAYGRKRYIVEISIDEGNDLEAVLERSVRVLEKTTGVLTKPTPTVVIDRIAKGVVNLKYFFWANPKEAVELALRTKVHQNLLLHLQKEGVSLGYETSAYFSKGDFVKKKYPQIKEEDELSSESPKADQGISQFD